MPMNIRLKRDDGDATQIAYTCPTGSCTFTEEFPGTGITQSSIAICSACADTTKFGRTGAPDPTYLNLTTNYSLPMGFNIEPKFGMGLDSFWLNTMPGDKLSWAPQRLTIAS
jgi:hypothetical protein